MKTKFFNIAFLPFVVCSCSNGPVQCINKYVGFSDAAKDFAKYDGSKYFVDIGQLEALQNKTVSYYISGLCAHRPIHHEFDDLCDDILANDARIYAVGDDYSINYNVLSSSVAINNSLSLEPYSTSYNDKASYFFDSFRIKDGYYPTECKSFNYLSITTDDDIGKQCYFLMSGDNVVGNVIYSLDTPKQTMEVINQNILSLIKNNK